MYCIVDHQSGLDVWELATSQHVISFRDRGYARAPFAVSDDSGLLAIARRSSYIGIIEIFTLPAGVKTAEIAVDSSRTPEYVCFNATSSKLMIIARYDRTLEVWDLCNGCLQYQDIIVDPEQDAHISEMWHTHSTVIMMIHSSRNLRLWDRDVGQELGTIKTAGRFNCTILQASFAGDLVAILTNMGHDAYQLSVHGTTKSNDVVLTIDYSNDVCIHGVTFSECTTPCIQLLTVTSEPDGAGVDKTRMLSVIDIATGTYKQRFECDSIGRPMCAFFPAFEASPVILLRDKDLKAFVMETGEAIDVPLKYPSVSIIWSLEHIRKVMITPSSSVILL
jgi:WD40 repeat protein